MAEIILNILIVLLAPIIGIFAAPIIILVAPFILIAKCLDTETEKKKKLQESEAATKQESINKFINTVNARKESIENHHF